VGVSFARQVKLIRYRADGQRRGQRLYWSHHPFAALTIATMPARIGSGNVGQARITRARSGLSASKSAKERAK